MKLEDRLKVEDDPETTLVLASASPRRYELLSLTGWNLRSLPVAVDETPRQGESAAELASRLAHAKCDEAIKESNGRPGIILGADTVVVHRGELLGKPRDTEDARRMLGFLRGGEHRVVTAVTLVSGSGVRVQELCSTAVPMREYAPEAVDAYLASGSALDKAGAYGIQDAEFDPVDRARMGGCFANVMGMPLCHVVRAMTRLGQPGRRDIPSACQLHTNYRCSAYRGILGPS